MNSAEALAEAQPFLAQEIERVDGFAHRRCRLPALDRPVPRLSRPSPVPLRRASHGVAALGKRRHTGGENETPASAWRGRARRRSAPRPRGPEPFPTGRSASSCPIAPGGSTDTSSRIIAEKLARIFGQQVVVDNKPGGGTIIGTESSRRAKPDGYTILLTPGALAVNAAFGVTLPYDSTRTSRRSRASSICRAARGQQRRAVQVGRRAARLVEGRSRPHHALCLGGRRQPDASVGRVSEGAHGMPLEHVGYKGSAEALKRRDGGPRAAVLRRADADGGADQGGQAARAGGGDGRARAAAARRADGRRGGPRPAWKAPFRSASRRPAARRRSWWRALNGAVNEALADAGGAPEARRSWASFPSAARPRLTPRTSPRDREVAQGDQGLEDPGRRRERSALRAAAQEAVDHAAAAGADVDCRRRVRAASARPRGGTDDPLAVDQRAPLAVVVEVGAGRTAIAFDAVRRAVAARIAGAGLLQFPVPVVVLGMALAVLPLGPISPEALRRDTPSAADTLQTRTPAGNQAQTGT